MNIIQEQYEQLARKYGEDRILWVAATPGYEGIDQDFIPGNPISAYYLPIEDELYNIESHAGLIDIRNVLSLALNQDLIFINSIVSPYKYINPKYKQYINDEFFTYLKLITFDKDEIIINKVKNIIKNLILFNMKKISQEQELLNILTKTELKVLEYIIKDFNNKNEGDIKVSQATERYNISTSVFRTLFYKLKEYEVATIDSRGVKGTHIAFYNISNLKQILNKGI